MPTFFPNIASAFSFSSGNEPRIAPILQAAEINAAVFADINPLGPRQPVREIGEEFEQHLALDAERAADPGDG